MVQSPIVQPCQFYRQSRFDLINAEATLLLKVITLTKGSPVMYLSANAFITDVAHALIAGPRGLRTHRYVAAANHSEIVDNEPVILTTSLMATPATTPLRDGIRGRHHGVAHFQLTCDFDPETLSGSIHVAFSGVWPSDMIGVSLNSAREAHPDLSICVNGEASSINRAINTVATHIQHMLADSVEEYARSVDSELYDWADMIEDPSSGQSHRSPLLETFLRGRTR